MNDQLESIQPMLIDLSAYDVERNRKTKPSRHYRQAGDNRTACGHLPVDGQFLQVPISIRAFLQVTDCKVCRETLSFISAVRVVARWKDKTPASNTGVKFLTGGETCQE
jgi:hypothetical protein